VNCREFEERIDFYLDGVLEAPAVHDAIDHIAACPTCESMVTGAQQAASLLKTAVSDRVAAVDVSGLWDCIERDLEPVPAQLDVVPESMVSGWRQLAGDGWRSFVAAMRGPGDVDWVSARGRTFGMLAVSAVAVVLVMGSWLAEPQRVQVADAGSRSKTKSVRIEALEVPAGATVSTWKRPRSRTQFISVTSRDDGFGVSNAGFSASGESLQ
jgi:hypothetical protein